MEEDVQPVEDDEGVLHLMQQVHKEQALRWKFEQVLRRVTDALKSLLAKRNMHRNALRTLMMQNKAVFMKERANIAKERTNIAKEGTNIARERADFEKRSSALKKENIALLEKRDNLQAKLVTVKSALKSSYDQMQELKKENEVLRNNVKTVECLKCAESIKERDQFSLRGGSKAYEDLENEFRAALQIEASHYTELRERFEKSEEGAIELGKMLDAATSSNVETKRLAAELSNMVSQQRLKMADLLKTHQELKTKYHKHMEACREPKESAERRIAELNKQMKEKDEELEEKKRNGRQQAEKVAAIQKEIEDLKRTCELSEGAKERLHEEKKVVLKLKEQHVDTEKELRLAHKENEKYQAMVYKLQDQCDELDRELRLVHGENKKYKEDYGEFCEKWKGRSAVIESLEVKVVEMKKCFDDKERKMATERNRLKEQLRLLSEKFRENEEAYKHGLQRVGDAHDAELRELIQEKNNDKAEAEKTFSAMERELRSLLKEKELQKSALASHVTTITNAFMKVQKELC